MYSHFNAYTYRQLMVKVGIQPDRLIRKTVDGIVQVHGRTGDDGDNEECTPWTQRRSMPT